MALLFHVLFVVIRLNVILDEILPLFFFVMTLFVLFFLLAVSIRFSISPSLNRAMLTESRR